MKTKFQTTAIPRALGNSVVMASVALLSVIGSAAYAQSFTSGPDLLVNRLCSDQCEQQGETLAVDAVGNTTAIWSEPYGETSAIVTARFDGATNKWSGSRLLAVEHGASPQIGYDANGNALAIWNTFREGYWLLRYSRYIASQGSWTRPADGLTLPVHGYAERLVVGKNGDAFVLNRGRNGEGSVARFDAATGTWNLFDGVKGERIAVDGTGNAVLLSINRQLYSGSVSLSARRFSASSRQWSGSTLLDAHTQTYDVMGNSNGTGEMAAPAMSLDAYGNVMFMWTKVVTADDGTAARTIRSARYVTSRGTWVSKTVPKLNNSGAIDAVLSADRSANVTAVWNQYVGSYAKTVASRYSSATGTWSMPTVIQSGSFHTREPNVGTDPQGNVTVSWSQRSDTGTQSSSAAIYLATVARFDAASGTWDLPQTIQDANRSGYRTFMGVDGKGRAVVMWTQQSGRYANGVGIKEIRSDRIMPR